MTEINMLEAKTNLTRLIRMLETKQEDAIIICRHGKPCAKLEFFDNKAKRRIVGRFEGKCPPLDYDLLDKMDDEIVDDIYSSMDEDIL